MINHLMLITAGQMNNVTLSDRGEEEGAEAAASGATGYRGGGGAPLPLPTLCGPEQSRSGFCSQVRKTVLNSLATWLFYVIHDIFLSLDVCPFRHSRLILNSLSYLAIYYFLYKYDDLFYYVHIFLPLRN